MRLHPARENKWPYLLSEGYSVESVETWDYNCIAFAADIQDQWWWPDANGDCEWPPGVKREVTLERFIEAYGTRGYKKCWFSLCQRRFERIAIYTLNGIPTHAAKQLPDGRWKSKLGPWEDIEHKTIKAVEEYIYGKAVVYMKRRRLQWQRTSLLMKFRLFLSRCFVRQQNVFSLTRNVNRTAS